MIEKNDEQIIQQIKEGLDFLDKSVRVNTPDLNKFKQLVVQVEEKKRVRQNLEFIVFLITAIVFLSAETIAFNLSLTSFIIVQIVAITILPLGLLLGKRQKNRQVDTI